MVYQIGSKVKFLNDVGGGIIKEILGTTAIVIDEDGFEIPVALTELIPDETGSYDTSDKNNYSATYNSDQSESHQDMESTIPFEQKLYSDFQGEVLLSLVPVNEQILHVSDFNLFIINDSNYYFMYLVSKADDKISEYVDGGTLEPDVKFEIKKFTQTDVSKIKKFRLQGIFFKYGLSDHIKPIDKQFSIENINFYKTISFKDNEYFDSKAIILGKTQTDIKDVLTKLSDKEIIEASIQKETSQKMKPRKDLQENTIEEVDLHLEKIQDEVTDLENSEILKIQMERFESALINAIKLKKQKIVFIHGIGNGKLKYELRNALDTKYPDLKYQDASFREYGYGATLVYLV